MESDINSRMLSAACPAYDSAYLVLCALLLLRNHLCFMFILGPDEGQNSLCDNLHKYGLKPRFSGG